MSKIGLILEGGAMRGMFTAGVTDVLMEHGVMFDGLVGVSAGAAFGCNYKSNQPGRAIRYNTKYCSDPRYCSLRSLLTTGDLYGAEFCYRTLPNELDLFDNDAFDRSAMEFHVVCTDVMTGEAVYHNCKSTSDDLLDWIRASASLPLVSRVVPVGGRLLLDGGITDPIPLRYFEGSGYARNVVILTQPEDYVKQKNRQLPLVRTFLRKYPKVAEVLSVRHIRYNESTAYIKMQEQAGAVFVFRPDAPLEIGAVEHKPRKLLAVYEHGRQTAEARLEELLNFMKKEP